jgi:hypothetical protein
MKNDILVTLLAPHLTPDNHAEVLGWARGEKTKLPIQEIVAKLAPRWRSFAWPRTCSATPSPTGTTRRCWTGH